MKRLLLAVAAVTGCASAEMGSPADAGAGGPADAHADARVIGTDAPVSTDGSVASACTTSVTCTNAQMLGNVSGDTGAATLSADGYQAAWYRVRVTEDLGDAWGLTLRVEASLTSPSAGMFETFVYLNESTDVVECSHTTGDRSSAGNVDDVRAEWGEGLFSNGEDDSRFVTIEVRPMTSSCSASATWHLDVNGNWL